MNKRWIIIGAVTLLSAAGFIAFAGTKGWINFGAEKKQPPDAKEELKKIYARYVSNTDRYEVSGTINIYDEENKHALKEQTSFRNVRAGSDYYSRLSQLQTFITDSFQLTLDTLEKTITLSGVTKEEIESINSQVFPLENYVADTSSLSIHLSVEEKGNQRVLTVKNDFTPEIKSVAIYYDPVNYAIVKTEIQWWKTFIIESEADRNKYWLSDIRLSEKKETGMNVRNEMDKIITRKGNELSLTEKYKGYRLIAIPAEIPGEEN